MIEGKIIEVEARILNNYSIQVFKKADVQDFDEYIYEITLNQKTTAHGFCAYLMLQIYRRRGCGRRLQRQLRWWMLSSPIVGQFGSDGEKEK
ncbi:unnamed protein product [Camellia sinensis]